MQTGVIHDFQKWCNMKTVPSTCSIHGAYWYKCFSKLTLALFIWKDQKQQLEQPEAKPSIWPGSQPMCPTSDHGTLLPPASHRAGPVCSLQNGFEPLQPLTESRTLYSTISDSWHLPPSLLCLGTVYLSTSFLLFQEQCQFLNEHVFSCFKLSAPLGTFPLVPGSGLMDKTRSHHCNTGVIGFLAAHHWECAGPSLS